MQLGPLIFVPNSVKVFVFYLALKIITGYVYKIIRVFLIIEMLINSKNNHLSMFFCFHVIHILKIKQNGIDVIMIDQESCLSVIVRNT